MTETKESSVRNLAMLIGLSANQLSTDQRECAIESLCCLADAAGVDATLTDQAILPFKRPKKEE